MHRWWWCIQLWLARAGTRGLCALASRLLGFPAPQKPSSVALITRGEVGAWAAASRFFRNPYSLVGREGSWCSDGYYTKALLVERNTPPSSRWRSAESQPELVSPVLVLRWEV